MNMGISTSRRKWDPKSLGECVLHWPLYRYGNEVPKIWDQSGNENHGIIYSMAPSSYSLLSDVELVVNGEFTSDTVDWSVVNGSLLAVGGGENATNCLQLTQPGEAISWAEQDVSGLVVGKRYKFRAWIKSGTSGDEGYIIALGADSQNVSLVGTTESSAWIYLEKIFTYTDTGGLPNKIYLLKNSSTVGTMRFDSISIQEIVGNESIGWYGVSNQYITVPLPVLDTITILLWVKPRRLYDNGGGAWRIFSFGKAGDDYRFDVAMYGPTSVSNWSAYSPVLAGWKDTNLPIEYDKWHCLGMSIGGTTLKCYKNGIKVTNDLTTGIALDGTHGFDINGSIGAANIYGIGSCYGEVIIYKEILSTIKIKSYCDMTRHIYGI